MNIRFIDVNGIRTRVLLAGSEKAYPLLLLHGYGGTADVWCRNMDELGRDFYAIANAEHFAPGEVAYADLRFDGRVVVKPLRAMPAAVTLPRAVVPVQITN